MATTSRPATCPACTGLLKLPARITPMRVKVVCPHCRARLVIELRGLFMPPRVERDF